MTPNPQDELLDRARKTIRDLREKLAAAEARRRPEPIAVIGMAFRFPGAGTDADKLWQMIAEGSDAVGSVPSDRWDSSAWFDPGTQVPGKINTRQAAFLSDVRRFDAGFFDITPREAIQMDPQQRIFLETAWHALEDTGLSRAAIAGTATGVFVGVHNHSADYQAMQFRNAAALDAWSATGSAHDVIAGRLSYWLDLRGPALAVNTACSSSLTAVHLACRSLRNNDCTIALAAGVNLLLGPGSTVAVAQLQLLSPDGHCRTFDARAAGMGRGEGCGVAVLKKLSAAKQDGDRVLAVIRGSAINQDGRTNGLTAPSGLAQQQLLRAALEDAGVDPLEVGYVETHGTGTALGDPIEVEALTEVLGGSGRKSACSLGAIKANLGHLEGAAGIAGLIKLVMVLRRRWLPPIANLEELNPHFALEGAGIEIPRAGRTWISEHKRIGGVSSFGFSGTNVHVVLEEAPPERAAAAVGGPWPVLVSAWTPEALRVLALAYADRLDAADAEELAGIAYTSAVRRTHHAHRIAVTGRNASEIAGKFRQRAEGSTRGPASDATILDEKLARWEAGAAIDWREQFPDGGRVIDLPLYPFEGAEYWLEETSNGSAGMSRAAESNADARSEEPPGDWLYSVQWVEKPMDSAKAAENASPASWLLIGADSELSRRLADCIRARGDEVVAPDLEQSQAGPNMSSNRRAFTPLSAEMTPGRTPLRYAVYVGGDGDAAESTADALRATQGILKSGLPLRLWFVLEGAGSVHETATAAQAALKAFVRVAGMEHPELVGGAIEADVASADSVCEEIARTDGECQISLRAGRRWVARLQRNQVRASALSLRQNRSYLVTGAFGRIGMEIAAWLIQQGSRHLVLVGRRDPSQMNKPEILRRIEAWKAQGIEVHALACDVADEASVNRVLDAMDSAGAPLAGVVHAAASVILSPLDEAPAETVGKSFHAKVRGAQVLDRCTRSRDLDFFALFGSTAATFGLKNAALYAPANAALESVAADRHAIGLRCTYVEWGVWESEVTGAVHDSVKQAGFAPMQPSRALAVLAALLADGRKSAVIADIDWRVLGPALEMRGRQSLIEGLSIESETQRPMDENDATTAWFEELAPLDAAERRNRILDFVGAETRLVFGMAPGDRLDETRGLFAMGMNSLMSVQLKRRLEAGTRLRLPGTLTLTYPSVSAIAGYLETAMFGTQINTAACEKAPSRGDSELKSLAEMNDEETNTALAAELAAVQRKLGAIEV